MADETAFRVAINTKLSDEEVEKDLVGQPFPVVIVDENTGEDLAKITLHRPSSTMLMFLISIVEGSAHKQSDVTMAMMNYFMHLVDDEDEMLIHSILMDPKVGFGIEQIGSILEASVEAWSARPTVGSSDSSDSPPQFGQISTQKPPNVERTTS